MYLLAKKLGFDKEMFKHVKINGEEPLIEDAFLYKFITQERIGNLAKNLKSRRITR